MRFASDSLHFTGTDLGDRTSGTSRRRFYEDEEDDDEEETSSTDENEEYEEELARLPPREREEIIVQNALQRIQRAQERGSTDVRLTKAELAALERRRKRLQEEAERRQREAASGSERRKRRTERVAIPLSQFEPISRGPTPSNHLLEDEDNQVYPPMGYFPPPAGTRTRPRSGTSASQRPPSRVGAMDERGSSPFSYEYMSRPSSAHRNISDTLPRPRSSRSIHHESPSGNRGGLDPFQFQTAGPRAPQVAGAAAASRRHVSGPAEMTQALRRGVAPPGSVRSSRGSRRPSPDETSEEASETSEETSGDETGHGAQIREPAVRIPPPRGRASTIVVEESPERRPDPPTPKKKSSGSSPSKRKPAASSGGRRRRK